MPRGGKALKDPNYRRNLLDFSCWQRQLLEKVPLITLGACNLNFSSIFPRLSSRSLWIESHSQVLLFNSASSDFNSRIEFFISFFWVFLKFTSSNLWITKWCLWLWLCVNLVSQFIGGRIHPLIYKKITHSHCAWEWNTARIGDDVVHRCQRPSRWLHGTALRLYATIGEIFIIIAPRKTEARKVKLKV